MLADVDDDPWGMCGRGIKTGDIAMALDHAMTAATTKSETALRDCCIAQIGCQPAPITNIDH